MTQSGLVARVQPTTSGSKKCQVFRSLILVRTLGRDSTRPGAGIDFSRQNLTGLGPSRNNADTDVPCDGAVQAQGPPVPG